MVSNKDVSDSTGVAGNAAQKAVTLESSLVDYKGFNGSLSDYKWNPKPAKAPIVLLIFGVPGVGKSYVMKVFQEAHKDYEVKILNYGDVMFEVASKNYGIKHRDEMRAKLSVEQQKEIQLKAASSIAEKSRLGTNKMVYCVDTHATVETPNGYLIGVPPSVFNILNPDAIFLFNHNPEVVSKQRIKDNEAGLRKRDPSTENIVRHQTVNQLVVEETAKACGVPAVIIERGIAMNPAVDAEFVYKSLTTLKRSK
ncbi:Adenylate kinase [uncultured archaeon]|nr:Adenylate kinase [uncultured archaeon]